MTQEQGLQRLFDVVHEDLRHPHYKRVTEKARLYMALVTGEGLDDYLQRVVRRESEELFKQRKEITQHITPSIMSRVSSTRKRVARSRYSQIISHQKQAGGNNNEQKATKDLNSVLSTFWKGKSLNRWMKKRWYDLNDTDPNAFVVIEFDGTDGSTLAQPYPYEVSSHNAIDFNYSITGLDYLIAREPKKIDDGGVMDDRYRFTLYLPNETIFLDPLPKSNGPIQREAKEVNEWNGKMVVWLNDKPYSVNTPDPHNIGRVQAERVGYNLDLYTGGYTYVAPYEAAVPYLRKTLKLNSEFDLSTTLTAHPYQIRYADPCDNPDCYKGTLKDGVICNACHGTGHKTITSGQEELVLSLPTHKDDLLDLSKMMAFVTPPIDIIKFQDELIEKISKAVIETVYNSDIFTRKELQETATGKNIALQNANDVLYDTGEAHADFWFFCVDVSARIIDREKGLVASMTFNKDFKLKDVRELFEDRKSALDSGAGPEIVTSIDNQIMSTLLIDNPVEYRRFIVRNRINPFTGVNPDEVMMIMGMDHTPKRIKVLYSNLNYIFDIIEEREGYKFYELNPQRQREIVDNEVTALLNELSGDVSAPVLNLN